MNDTTNISTRTTDEERRRNLDLALQARRERSVLKAAVAYGDITFTDALDDPRAKRIHVRNLIGSLPGIGRARTERIMGEIGIAPDLRVARLGMRQRKALLSLLGGDSMYR